MNTPRPLFDVKPVDARFYEERLRDFLPDRLLDVHTHVWQGAHLQPRATGKRTVTWPARVAAENTPDDLAETYRLMFPGKHVTPLVFGTIRAELDPMNAYVQAGARARGWPALIFSDPRWPAEEFERRIVEGGFLGAKSYLSLAPAYLPAAEIRIFDFFPPHQLDVLNRRGGLLMLHIPRPDRLRDPVNLAQILEIEERYPAARLIVAHVGRAYCPEDVGTAFETLAPARRLRFDISANTNDAVFEKAIRAVGPERLLFGSDLPILRMRMKRICEKGLYVNLVPRGLYGDVAGDKNMREIDPPESDAFTFFMYEEIDAFRRAAERAGLTRAEVRAVFHDNAVTLLRGAGWAPQPGA